MTSFPSSRPVKPGDATAGPAGPADVVGLLHPGSMGAGVGGVLAANAIEVRWVSAGRSQATAGRAAEAGLRPVSTVHDLVEGAGVVLSICPPAAAVAVAAEVARVGFHGVYVDANAISPSTAVQIADVIGAAGASFVDGGIIGPPPADGARTMLYLSGPDAPIVAQLFEPSGALQVSCLGTSPTAASALKMCYAAWTKGTQALLLAVRRAAAVHGVGDALVTEWEVSQPTLVARCEAAVRSAPKAWRWSAEMEEAAVTFASAGLPAGFLTAAADIFGRLEGFKDTPPDFDAVMAALDAR